MTSKLQEYRFDLSWVEEIVDLIQRVTSVPLLPGQEDFVQGVVLGCFFPEEKRFRQGDGDVNSRASGGSAFDRQSDAPFFSAALNDAGPP